jgi:O-antigen ligase
MSPFLMSKAIFRGLLLAIVFTALAHGAVESWSVAVFGALVIGLLVMWAIKAFQEKQLVFVVPAAAWPMAALLLYVMIQSLAFSKSDGQMVSLSMDVEATRSALPVVFFLFAGFLLAVNFLNTPERLKQGVSFLIFYGFGLALFALLQYFTWNGRIYWLRPTEFTAFGPFVNRNHFAGYMEMLIPLPVALMVARAIRKEMWLMYGFLAALMSLAVILSLSRGGMISVLMSLVFLALAKSRLRRSARKRQTQSSPLWVWLKGLGGIAALSLVLATGVVWLGAEPVLNRLGRSIEQLKTEEGAEDAVSRSGIWRDTKKLFQAHMIFGVGLGAYETVFPAYSLNSIEMVVTHAHNDYLQILADCGLIGGVIGLWFLVVIFRAVWQGLKSPDGFHAALALGGGAGIFAMLLHSLFDFNLQIPSNALLFLTLCAMVSHIALVTRKAEKKMQMAIPAHLAKTA